mmetsp:Transcript_21353/g.49621  ORF Transcript_21353/g.49621 Transcript_21353/m.49621 type:complete len:792 (-) Transcript_21353:72-2447(-)
MSGINKKRPGTREAWFREASLARSRPIAMRPRSLSPPLAKAKALRNPGQPVQAEASQAKHSRKGHVATAVPISSHPLAGGDIVNEATQNIADDAASTASSTRKAAETQVSCESTWTTQASSVLSGRQHMDHSTTSSSVASSRTRGNAQMEAPTMAFAIHWVSNRVAPPSIGTKTMVYPGGISIDVPQLSEVIDPVPEVSAQWWSATARAIESGDISQMSLQVYQEVDRSLRGFLAWDAGLEDFLMQLLERYGLEPLPESQMYHAFSCFDRGRNVPLDARGCLCLADALFRAILHCTDRSEEWAAQGLRVLGGARTPRPAPPSHEVRRLATADTEASAMASCQHAPSWTTPYAGTEVALWAPHDVARWAVDVLGLPADLGRLLAEEEIHGPVLLSLTEADLEGLGVKPFGRRRQLLLGIEALRSGAAASLVADLVSVARGATSLSTDDASSTANSAVPSFCPQDTWPEVASTPASAHLSPQWQCSSAGVTPEGSVKDERLTSPPTARISATPERRSSVEAVLDPPPRPTSSPSSERPRVPPLPTKAVSLQGQVPSWECCASARSLPKAGSVPALAVPLPVWEISAAQSPAPSTPAPPTPTSPSKDSIHSQQEPYVTQIPHSARRTDMPVFPPTSPRRVTFTQGLCPAVPPQPYPLIPSSFRRASDSSNLPSQCPTPPVPYQVIAPPQRCSGPALPVFHPANAPNSASSSASAPLRINTAQTMTASPPTLVGTLSGRCSFGAMPSSSSCKQIAQSPAGAKTKVATVRLRSSSPVLSPTSGTVAAWPRPHSPDH